MIETLVGSHTSRAWEHTLLWRTHYPGGVPGVNRHESKDDLNLTSRLGTCSVHLQRSEKQTMWVPSTKSVERFGIAGRAECSAPPANHT